MARIQASSQSDFAMAASTTERTEALLAREGFVRPAELGDFESGRAESHARGIVLDEEIGKAL